METFGAITKYNSGKNVKGELEFINSHEL